MGGWVSGRRPRRERRHPRTPHDPQPPHPHAPMSPPSAATRTHIVFARRLRRWLELDPSWSMAMSRSQGRRGRFRRRDGCFARTDEVCKAVVMSAGFTFECCQGRLAVTGPVASTSAELLVLLLLQRRRTLTALPLGPWQSRHQRFPVAGQVLVMI